MGADQRPIPDIDAAMILKVAATVDKDIFADVDVFAALRVKGWEQGEAFVDLLPGQFGKESADFFRLVIALIENGGDLHRFKRQLDHVLVGFRAARAPFPRRSYALKIPVTP